MPSGLNRFSAVFRYALTVGLSVGPIVLFCRIFQAEGPLLFLYAAVGLCASLIFFFFAGYFRRLSLFLAVLIAVLFIFAVLVQVNIARRSLAEAWLELARTGRAFGFFSFFSAEVYALFCLPQAILFCMKKYRLFFIAAVTANSLCAGIILGNSALLALCFFSFFVFLIASERSWEALRTRLVSIAFPAVGGILLAAALSSFGAANPEAAPLISYPDFSVFLGRLAPSFPLLRDVPGYGTSMGGGEMPESIFLSDRPIFQVRGEPFSAHYLALERYAVWNGVLWLEDTNEGEPLPLAFFGASEGESGPALRLTLVEDFYAAIPIAQETEAVLISRDAPKSISLTRNRGLRFEGSARRGLEIGLVNGPGVTSAEKEAAMPQYSGMGSETSIRISALAAELKLKAGIAEGAGLADNTGGSEAERRYLQALLDYFSTGFTYALETGKKAKGETPIEHFLFTEKKGFCLYYASAFVLLAREFGLPARMAAGFRVSLDETGGGIISGNNAHAWSEVWIDGQWRLFEPTPPFAREDPFSWSDAGDRSTRRQLEALFGSARSAPGAERDVSLALYGFASRHARFLLPTFALALLTWTLIMYRLNKGTGKIRRRAARLVRRCRKQGVVGPEITGWLEWARQASARNPGSDADALAKKMMELAFSGERANSSQAARNLPLTK